MHKALLDLLADSPLLLVFVVAAIGVLVGRIRVAGFSLGIAAVLFVGLAFSALGARLVLPEFVFMFGLAVFVYMVGLASGPGFVAALRRQGLRDNLLALGVIAIGFAVALGAAVALSLGAPLAAGLFAGSTTNTPALAAVVESVRVGAADPEALAGRRRSPARPCASRGSTGCRSVSCSETTTGTSAWRGSSGTAT